VASIKDKLHPPLVIFSVASFYFFLLGIQLITPRVGSMVSLVVVAFFFVVLLIQILSLKVIFLKLGTSSARFAMLGFLLAANLVAFFLSFSVTFMTMPNLLIALATILAALVFTALFRFSRLGGVIGVSLCVLIVCSLFLMGVSIIFGDTGDPAPGSLAGYRNIEFVQKPNVHLISFDAMIPEVLASKYMGLEQLGYSDYLVSESAIVFKNHFSSQAPSSNSLNSVMRLANSDFKGSGYFAGRDESPVSYIFKNNGYKLATGYDNFHVFGKPGSHIDEYRVTYPRSISGSAICRLNGLRSNIVRLFGFCHYMPIILLESQPNDDRWAKIVSNTIREKGKSNEPWLTFHYLQRPIGHTTNLFNSNSPADLDEYTQTFSKRSKRLDTILPEIVEIIRVNDPTSIVFIFGDHGPYLSRTLAQEESPEFYVQDRHGILGALLATEHPCSIKDIEFYNQEYSTPERVLSGIIKCLSADPGFIDQGGKFDESFDFRKYLYE